MECRGSGSCRRVQFLKAPGRSTVRGRTCALRYAAVLSGPGTDRPSGPFHSLPVDVWAEGRFEQPRQARPARLLWPVYREPPFQSVPASLTSSVPAG